MWLLLHYSTFLSHIMDVNRTLCQYLHCVHSHKHVRVMEISILASRSGAGIWSFSPDEGWGPNLTLVYWTLKHQMAHVISLMTREEWSCHVRNRLTPEEGWSWQTTSFNLVPFKKKKKRCLDLLTFQECLYFSADVDRASGSKYLCIPRHFNSVCLKQNASHYFLKLLASSLGLIGGFIRVHLRTWNC